MPQVSINILTKDRSVLLREALDSVIAQTFTDYEIIVVNDGSTDDTSEVLAEYTKKLPLTIINHESSRGIIAGRQEALAASHGDYVALLDDDDEWLDKEKLAKQVQWFKDNPGGVLVGGAVKYLISAVQHKIVARTITDKNIRESMLLRNNFFTSTVMFKKAAAVLAGGFLPDVVDVAEDYDLWLRLGKLGQMANFGGVFTAYRAPVYTDDKFKMFLHKQLTLAKRQKNDYPMYWLSWLILHLRLYWLFLKV